MATYNGGTYLPNQIESILNQTIQDFELIICDDHSTDNTFAILQEYAKKDNRIKLFQNEKNLGFKKNFEKSIMLCHGDYIALSDQDDIWMPNHLELLKKEIGFKALACGNALLINEDGKSLGITLKTQESLDMIPDNDLKKLMSIIIFRNPYQGASMLFNKQALIHAFPFPEEVSFHDTWLAAMACLNGGLSYVKTPILQYRRLNSSITGLRLKKKSRYINFRYQIIYKDRVNLVNHLIKRNPHCNEADKKMLNKILIVFHRTNTLWGRIKNTFFYLRNFKTIYSC